jgi:hypothetical protein
VAQAHGGSGSVSGATAVVAVHGCHGPGLPLTTDELRLQQAEAEVAESRARQRQRTARLQRVLLDVGKHMPTRSTKGLTMPHEFSFLSDARARSSAAHDAAAAAAAGGGVEGGGGTRGGGGGAARPFVPLAEAMSKFEFRQSAPLPPSGHGGGNGSGSGRRLSASSSQLGEDSALSAGGGRGPTVLKPFRLHTETRARYAAGGAAAAAGTAGGSGDAGGAVSGGDAAAGDAGGAAA